MIAIENVLLSDDIISEKFVCDLNKCKGGCCEDGDAGAPLTKKELQEVNDAFPKVLPLLTKAAIDEINASGRYVWDREFGWVTPSINGGLCVYGYKDEAGIIKCSFEQLYNEGKIKWKKPISCHLFPIRISESSDGKTEYANYEPRDEGCNHACALGKKLKVPVYQFLKEPIIRKYGEDFYNSLHATAEHVKKEKTKKR